MICRLLSHVLLLPLWLALAGMASAQNPTNGKNIYDTYCSGCHGTNPATNKDNVLNGKTYSGLVNAWTLYKSDMPYLFPSKVFTDAEMDDIASYLASKAGGGGTVQFSAAPTSQNFGSVAVGAQSGGTTFTVSNIGTASGTITAINNNNAAEFAITGGSCTPAPKSVANGASCTIIVAFKPSTTGARSGSITINNSGIVSPLSLTLSGTGGAAATPGQLSMPGAHGFGTQPLNVQSSAWSGTITNIGGAAVNVTTVTNSNGSEFPVTVNTCVGGVGAGSSCSVSVAFKPTATGARSATLTVISNGVGSPQNFVVSGTGQAAATPGQLSVQGSVVFGTQGVGVPAGQGISVTNIGGSAVTVSSVSSNNPGEFAVSSNSCAGSVGAGMSCGFNVTFTPAAAGARGATITLISSGTGSPQFIAASGTGTTVAPPPGSAVTAVEFYNSSLDHYFLSHITNEIALLDAGVTIKGWVRTGQSFKVYSTVQAASSPVCRFYIPPDKGNSHFYGRGTAECNATGAGNPTFVNEDSQFFHMMLPTLGVCPAGTRNVYRTFSNRLDANHRYMIDPAIRDFMVSKNWTAEGDGPNLVVMCSPL